MPHFTIEYSANLDERVDMSDVVELVRKAAVETGIFPIGGIRVRAIKCEHYAIADGNPQLSFLSMVLRLGEGRDLAARKKAGEHIFKALSAYLDPVFGLDRFMGDKTAQPDRVWGNPQAIALLSKLMDTNDPAVRQPLFDELQTLFAEDAPMVVWSSGANVSAFSPAVHGYAPWPGRKPRFWNVEVVK